MRTQVVFRIRILSGILVLGAILLIARLYVLQIVQGDEFREKAEGQYAASSSDIVRRGDILFSRRDRSTVAAAVVESGSRIAIEPAKVRDAEATYQALAEHASIERDRFFASAAKIEDPYEEVASRLDQESAKAIRALKIPGVMIVKDGWRMYPGEALSAHVVGFLGHSGGMRAGVYGLERYYEDTLRRSEASLYINPFAAIFSNIAEAIQNPGPPRGDVVTAIEPNVAVELERVLKNVHEKYHPHHIGGIIMDPKTGEIIAMSALPTFNPNTYNTVPDPRIFSNPIVESRFEMGSIMKPLTIAAAVDAGAITPQTTFNDKGYVIKSGARIQNHDGKVRGVVSMQEVLNESLNTGIAFVVDRMGHDPFLTYFKNYGLGEETGIDLPGEIAGDISALTVRGASDVDFASAGFGQGIAVTPISMIRALGALANQGVLPEPHVARSVRLESGLTREIALSPSRRVISEETAETITRMLVEVFDDALLRGELKQEHHSIAAKTGTAQIADPSCSGYCAGRFLHSFFGYFPAYPHSVDSAGEGEQRFIILLYMVEPQGVEYASQSLARPFLELTKYLIQYYNIPPDR